MNLGLGGIRLARHGETDDNLPPQRFQGWTDTPLNETGRRQAHELAATVAGDGIASLWASDLSRARETAEIVGERIGMAPVLDARLREGARGRWEGFLMQDIERAEPERYAAWRRAGADFRFPGGRIAARAPAARHRGPGRDPRRRPATGARRLPRREHPGHALCRRPARARRLPHLRRAQRGGGPAVSRAPVAAFVALVIATVAAFFVTQHLKVTTPFIQGSPAPVPEHDQPGLRRVLLAAQRQGRGAPRELQADEHLLLSPEQLR